MASTSLTENRQDYLTERARITGESDSPVALDADADREIIDALTQFVNAADPERSRTRLRKPRKDGTLKDVELSNRAATDYLEKLRLTYQRGFDLLGGTATEYNDFMADMVDGVLPSYGGRIERTTAGGYQSAARAFYRFCSEPGKADDRPDTRVEWPATDIIVYSDVSEPRHDEADMFEDAEVDALREACLKGRNPRRDRAFVELLAGSCQRLTVIRTLRVGDVYPDAEVPYFLINDEIKDDGDKGAIENAGRWRPIVSDTGPIREWLRNHPLRDAAVREAHGARADFEDCYVFVGDVTIEQTEASQPWSESSAFEMLKRRKEATARMPGVATVTKPVNPHNFRHYAYTKSQELPIDESVRRMMFGWVPGSDTGERIYGHTGTEQAGQQFAEAWREAFGDASATAGVAESVVGGIAAGNLPPEVRRTLVQEILADEQAKQELVDGLLSAAD